MPPTRLGAQQRPTHEWPQQGPGPNKWMAPVGPRAQQGPSHESPGMGPTGPGAPEGPTNEWAQAQAQQGPIKQNEYLYVFSPKTKCPVIPYKMKSC